MRTSGPGSGPAASAWKRIPFATSESSSIPGSCGRMWGNRHTTGPKDIWSPPVPGT